MENKNITLGDKLYSLLDISKEADTPYRNIQKTALRYGIIGTKIGKILYFTRYQKKEILKRRRIKSRENHVRKIRIIEFYLLDKNADQIAKATRVRECWVLDCIEEFNKYGTITVESKINYK